jgi:alpha-ketoglutarate-dependent taurine dioxygenase
MTVHNISNVTVRQILPSVGAEISGLDISKPLDDETLDLIRSTLHEHSVVFFPGQDLDIEGHLEFSQQFGEPSRAHPVYPGPFPEHPEIAEFGSRIRSQEYRSTALPGLYAGWHSDQTFVDRPPVLSIFRAEIMPEVGGGTLFVSTSNAYDRLSAPLQRLVDELVAVHDGRDQNPYLSEHPSVWDGQTLDHLDLVRHPLVRTHPESGRKSLWINPNRISHIEGLARHESDSLLDLLNAHTFRSEFLLRYQWAPGTVGIWDNRTTLHNAVNDYGDVQRLAYRVTITGERPYGPALAAA